MRKMLSLIGIAFCLTLGLKAQVIGLNPTPIADYYWDTTTSAWEPCPNSSAAEAYQSTPQAEAQYGLNATLGQWTPRTACPAMNGDGVTQIIPGINITISPSSGTGAVTINAIGSTISVNGATVPSPDFNGTSPAAQSGYVNGIFQVTSLHTISSVAATVEIPPGVQSTNWAGNYPLVFTESGGSGAAGIATIATSSIAPGSISQITLTNNGGGYSSASLPNVTITGGGGSGATAVAVYDIGSRGSLASITVTNGGSGYTSAPTVTIDAPPSGPYAGQATATATYATSTVFSFSSITTTVTNGGTGYTSDVAVTSPTIPYGSYSFVATATTGGGQQVSVEVPDVITINDTSCVLGGSCTIATGSGSVLMQQVVPPTSGQYVIVYPTAVTGSAPTPAYGVFEVVSAVVGTDYYCLGGRGGSGTWSNPQLPSSIDPSSVTAIYAFAITHSSYGRLSDYMRCFGQPVTIGALAFETSASGTSGNLTPSGLGTYWSPTQTNQLLSSVTGSMLSSQTISMSAATSVPDSGPSVVADDLVGWIVYYTGTPVTENTGIQVVSPLTYNSAANTLSIDPAAEFPGTALVPTEIISLPLVSASTGWIVPITNGATSTDCTTGGGTNYVQCYSNGSTWSAYTPQLGTLASLNISGALTAGSVQAGSLQDNGAVSTAGKSCLQIDTAGIISNTGEGCGGSGGSVTQLIAGTSNVTLSPSGGTGNVTISVSGGGGGGLLSGANVVITGDSIMQDDTGATAGAVTIATAINCNSTGICTVVDNQSYSAGQWVFLGTSGISPACIGTLNSEGYYGTGNRIYQVLSAGLSSILFEVQTNGCISTSGTGGTVEDATFFLAQQIAAQPAFKSANSWALRNGVDAAGIYRGYTGLVCEQATNFNAMYGDLLPSVTGKPLVFLEESGGTNDIYQNGSEPALQACFQSFWSQAHAAGATVVQGTIPYHATTATVTDVNNWILLQGKSNSNSASGQYWDYPGADMRVYGGMGSPPSQTQVVDISQAWDAALEAPGASGITMPGCTASVGCASLNGNNVFTGQNQFTSAVIITSANAQTTLILNDGDINNAGVVFNNYSGVPHIQAANSGRSGTDQYYNDFLGFFNYGGHDYDGGINIVTAPIFGAFGFSTSDIQDSGRPDTCLTRNQTTAGEVDFGNCSSPGDMSGTIGSNAIIGPATAPSGSCSVNGRWVFSQDGHATFCASGTWVTKI